MNIARLNGSHANLNWHQKAIKMIQETIPNVPILLDLPGKKVRTRANQVEPEFDTGEILVFSGIEKNDGISRILVSDKEFEKRVTFEDIFFADDGSLSFQVVNVSEADVYAKALIAGKLKNRKGVNTPLSAVKTEGIPEEDSLMIEMAKANQVDFVGLSFVESREEVEIYREKIGGRSPKIVAKIENRGGLQNLSEIVGIADAILIDRGDLSVETQLFDLAIKQKHIISVALGMGKPVIVATEMLHTMVENSVPTKSEVIDIANAVIDGCSATMLSGETAVGKFPIEAVSIMRQVIHSVEEEKSEGSAKVTKITDRAIRNENILMALSEAIYALSRSLPITKIIAVSRHGYLVEMLSRLEFNQAIIAVSDSPLQAKAYNLFRGTLGYYSKEKFFNDENFILNLLRHLISEGLLTTSDLVLVSGISFAPTSTRANSIYVFNVGEIA